MSPKVHTFESTSEAYDWLNVGLHPETDEPINNGDVLVVASEGVIGFACSAWPVAVVYPGPQWDGLDEETHPGRDQIGGFHLIAPGSPIENEYAASIKLCVETAHSDADITGNAHWANASIDDKV